MAKSNWREFMDKMSREVVYFKYDFEEAVLKSVPGEGFYVKFKGKREFKAQDDSKLVTDAILEHEEISKKEYDDFGPPPLIIEVTYSPSPDAAPSRSTLAVITFGSDFQIQKIIS